MAIYTNNKARRYTAIFQEQNQYPSLSLAQLYDKYSLLVNAIEWYAPHATCITFFVARPFTNLGLSWACVPRLLPSWPILSEPQLKSWPHSSRATECCIPQSTDDIVQSLNVSTSAEINFIKLQNILSEFLMRFFF